MGDQSQTKTRPAEDFCRSCGLCCNGTLYARVPLVPSDSLDSLSRAGASVDGPGENRALSLPCGAFASGDCTVYEERPQTCQSFVCHLLAELQATHITIADAQDVLARAHALISRLSERMTRETGMTQAVAPAEFARQLRSNQIAPGATVQEFEREYGGVLEELQTVRVFLAQNFSAAPASNRA